MAYGTPAGLQGTMQVTATPSQMFHEKFPATAADSARIFGTTLHNYASGGAAPKVDITPGILKGQVTHRKPF